MTENPYRIHIRHGDFELDVEGDRAFVESYIEAFLSEGAVPEADEEPELREKPAPKAKRVVKGGVGGGGRRKELPAVQASDLKRFMKGKKFKGNKQRYLEYIRFWKQAGVDEVSDAHMRACYLAEGLDTPPTGRQHFTSMGKEGILKPGSARGLWVLAQGAERAAGKPKKAARKAPAKRVAPEKEKSAAPMKAAAKKTKAKVKKEKAPPARKAKAAKKAPPKAAARARRKPAREPAQASEAQPAPAAEVPPGENP